MGLFNRVSKIWSQDMAIDLGTANTFNDFRVIAFTLLSTIKLSSTNAIISSS